jgi:membrane protein DedA with SNARE-associated domain
LSILGVLAIAVAMALALIHLREVIWHIGSWGYLGVFLAELASSATVLIPTPGSAYTLTMSAVLNPFLLGLLGGVASSRGELVGYGLGVKGSRALQRVRGYERVCALATRWGGGALFTFALLPLAFDVAGIWAGTVRYPLWRFLFYVMAGKVIKVTGIALVGYYGATWLLGPVG